MKEQLTGITTWIGQRTAPAITFLSRYWLYIMAACFIVLGVLYFSLPKEVEASKREDKQKIKAAQKSIQKAHEKVEKYQDTVRVYTNIITRLYEKNTYYDIQDSLLLQHVRQDIATGTDTYSATATERFLTNYQPAPYDTLR